MADVLPGIVLERLEKSPLADEATDLLLPRSLPVVGGEFRANIDDAGQGTLKILVLVTRHGWQA
jgi:hypothetical protein